MLFTEKEQKKLEELERAFQVLRDPNVVTSPSIGHVFSVPYENRRKKKELQGIAEKIADLQAKKILAEKDADPDKNYSEYYKIRSEEEKKLLDENDE